MILEQLKIGAMENFTYLIGDEKTGEAAVVDPHGNVPYILEAAESKGLKIKYIVNTHTHWDHVAGNQELKERTGARVLTHSIGKVTRDKGLEDEDNITLGALEVRVLHTPGHTPDSICLLVDGKLVTGDTLFVGNCGRTDLPGGDPGKLYDSLFGTLGKLGDEVEVYPGHDYGPTPSSTLGRERRENHAMAPRSRDEFLAYMGTP